MTGIAKVQHYVPQFLLREFGTGKKRHLHVFDKRTDTTFISNTRNVASESRFYDFQFEGVTLTLEPGLSRLEGAAKPIVEQLLRRDTLDGLADADRSTLAAFFAVQLTRTRAFREQWRAMEDLLRDTLRGWAHDDSERAQVDDFIGPRDDTRATAEFARIVSTAPKTFGHYFLDKTWVLLRTDRSRPFMIGDNPLTLHNSIDMGPRGNLGLGVVGVELYFPLSPTRALAMWCPSLVEELLAKDTQMRTSPAYAYAQQVRPDHWIALDALVSAIRSGTPLASSRDNLLHFNSLQVRYAERYLFSSINDFELARSMVTSPEDRFGPRLTME